MISLMMSQMMSWAAILNGEGVGLFGVRKGKGNYREGRALI